MPLRRSLCWRKLRGRNPGREETNPGSHAFSTKTPSPLSGLISTWSTNTVTHHTNETLLVKVVGQYKNDCTVE